MLERRGEYRGDAELVVDDGGSLPVKVSLVGYVDVTETALFGAKPERFDGVESWDGLIEQGMSGAQMGKSLGVRMDLRVPDGKVGRVALRDVEGHLSGFGPAPFGIERHSPK